MDCLAQATGLSNGANPPLMIYPSYDTGEKEEMALFDDET
jgi:hypothetical protein